MDATTATKPEFYRTRKGSKAHRSFYCANARRSFRSGDPLLIPAKEIADWAPCLHCCTAEDIANWAAIPAPQAPAKCNNSGVVNSRRIYSTCKDCGKEGKVNRRTGTIVAHLPLAS